MLNIAYLWSSQGLRKRVHGLFMVAALDTTYWWKQRKWDSFMTYPVCPNKAHFYIMYKHVHVRRRDEYAL